MKTADTGAIMLYHVRQSLVRNLARFIDTMLTCGVCFAAMTGSDKRKRVGDRMAGTVVVRTGAS
ncbi:MAG: hypothetical protein ABIJ56_13135 [Pseudomonadota bacterium]